jgi:hypothetical protein
LQSVTITGHGRPVCQIILIQTTGPDLQDRIARLVADGVLEPSPAPIPAPKSAAQRRLRGDRDASAGTDLSTGMRERILSRAFAQAARALLDNGPWRRLSLSPGESVRFGFDRDGRISRGP